MSTRVTCVTFLMTYQCNSECRHCIYRASPHHDISITPEDVRRDLLDLSTIPTIDSIYFFGGEPLLHYELLVSLIREVIRAENPAWKTVGIITNGFWGERDTTAREYAVGMKEAGLNSLIFSVDAFHQEFVPLETVKGAIRAARNAGIEQVRLNAKSLGDVDMDNEYNRQTRQIVEELEGEFEFDEVDIRPLMVAGRAADTLAEHLPMTELPWGECKFDNVRDPTYAEIDPEGWVWICSGIAIGNTGGRPVSEILEGYRYEEHLILGRIGDENPQGLLELAMEKGYQPPEGYAEKCHLCYSVRRFLHPFYPEILVPSHLYQ